MLPVMLTLVKDKYFMLEYIIYLIASFNMFEVLIIKMKVWLDALVIQHLTVGN